MSSNSLILATIIHIVLLSSPFGQASDLYLGPGASSSPPACTFATPCTIDAISTRANVGDTILTLPGLYQYSSATLLFSNVTFIATTVTTPPSVSFSVKLYAMSTVFVGIAFQRALSVDGALTFRQCLFQGPSPSLLYNMVLPSPVLTLVSTTIATTGSPLAMCTPLACRADQPLATLTLDSVSLNATSPNIFVGYITNTVVANSELTAYPLAKLATGPQSSLRVTGSTIRSTKDLFGTNSVNTPRNMNVADSSFLDNSGAFFSLPTAASLVLRNVLVQGHIAATSPLFDLHQSPVVSVVDSTFASNSIDKGLFALSQTSNAEFINTTVQFNQGGGACMSFSQSVVKIVASGFYDNSLVQNLWNTSTIFHLYDATSSVTVTDSFFERNGGPSSIYTAGLPLCFRGTGLRFFNSYFLNNNDFKAVGAKCLTGDQLCPCSSDPTDCTNCTDIDICAKGTALCSTESTTCRTTNPGQYACDCRPDYPNQISEYFCAKPAKAPPIYFSSPNAKVPPNSNFSQCTNESKPCDLQFLLQSPSRLEIRLLPGVYFIPNSTLSFKAVFTIAPFDLFASRPVLDFQGLGAQWKFRRSEFSQYSFGSIEFAHLGPRALRALGSAMFSFTDCVFRDSYVPPDAYGAIVEQNSGDSSPIIFIGCTVYNITAPIFAIGYKLEIRLYYAQILNNNVDVLFSSIEGVFTVGQSVFAHNAVSQAHLLRISKESSSELYINSVTETAFIDSTGVLVDVNASSLTLTGVAVLHTSVPPGKELIHLDGTSQWHTFTATNCIFAGSNGTALGIGGALSARNVTCQDTTDNCFHFLPRNVPGRSTMIGCSVVRASQPSGECGVAIKVSDPNASIYVYTSSFLDNSAGLGLFCVDTSTCAPDQTLLTLASPDITGNSLANGSAVGFFEGPSLPSDCKAILSFTNYNSSLGSYPVAFVAQNLEANLTANQTSLTVQFNFTLHDFYGQEPPPLVVKDYFLCYQHSDQIIASVPSPLNLTATTFSLNFTIVAKDEHQPYLTPDVYPIEFGPYKCPTPHPGPYALHMEKRLTISLHGAAEAPTIIVTPTAPTDNTALIVGISIPAGMVVMASTIGVGLLIYCKRRMQRGPRLISKAGLVQTQMLTKLLTEASVPLVEADDIEIIETIGSGATGVVVRGIWLDRAEMQVAVKQLPSASLHDLEYWSQGAGKLQVKELITELKILIQLDHPNVLPLLAASIISPTDIRLVSPYMPNRSLAAHLQTLADDKRVLLAKQIAWALEYLQTKSIVHRDLKPENVLLSENWTAYVCDFARSTSSAMTYNTTNGLVGSAAYTAPEIIANGAGDYSSDVYSYGVVVLELLTKQRAYPSEMNAIQVMLKVSQHHLPKFPAEFKVSRPKWIPEGLIELVERCLSFEASDRPSIKEVCDVLKSMS